MTWLSRLLWAVGAVMLLRAAARLAVPPLVKWQAEKHLSELLGHMVTLGEVNFSPWALRLTLNDMAVARAPVRQPWNRSSCWRACKWTPMCVRRETR